MATLTAPTTALGVLAIQPAKPSGQDDTPSVRKRQADARRRYQPQVRPSFCSSNHCASGAK